MKNKFLTTFSAIAAVLIAGFGLFLFSPKPDLLNELSFSHAIYDANHQLLRLTLSKDEKYRLFTPLENISSTAIKAILLKEDKHFYEHHGVNIGAIVAAFWQTYIKNQDRRGASTITMQVARLRYKLATRTISGKLLQIMLALKIELSYSKSQILEAYLNLAPYGNNIEGIGAASLIYYHQPPKNLTLAQALTLSIIPQRPGKRSLDNLNYEWIIESRFNLFQRWIERFPDDEKFSALMTLPLVNFTRQELPFHAPHFIDYVTKNISPQERNPIMTSLDLKQQRIVEQNISKYLAMNNKLNIHNAAALLIDTNDMSIKAMIGSADFFNQKIDGQVNGVLAKRSPGSTLKPFIYALAIDQGLIHPATVLKDAPISFGAYNPENFDNTFLGPLKAKDALILSRNIPAIYLASQLKHPTFYEFLLHSGMQLQVEKNYGLSLVLGGAEISMKHLAELYAMLANQGVYYPLNFLAGDELDDGQRMLSREASFLSLDMLQNNRQPRQINLATTNSTLPVAWKTGTSSGYRDAWTVGVFGHYVLAVWIGNFSGQGNPAFIGRDLTAPLFFNIVNSLTKQLPSLQSTTQNWKDLNLTKIAVCDASGMLPTPACPRTILTWFIPGKSPIKKDTVYREIMINPDTGRRACEFNSRNKFAVFEFWSSDLLKIFQQAGIARRTPPAYEQTCNLANQMTQGMGPHITSPKSNVNYTITSKTDQTIKVPLMAIADADVDKLHWFADDAYIGQSAANQTIWWVAKPGRYIIRAVDNYSRVNSVQVTVSTIASASP